MKRLAPVTLAAALALAAPPAPAQDRDEARPRDLQRLQEDLANLDEELGGLEKGDAKADALRARAEEIREETIYLKVKMRRHRKAGREGTGVSYDEVADLRRAIADLRGDLEAAFGAAEREVRIPEGTQLRVRLDESLSSRTARREDRFEASVARPVRAGGVLAVPAGTRVRGVVRDVEPAQRPAKGGRLELDFDALYLDRTRIDIKARVVSLHEDDKGEAAEKAGIGAILGGVVGGILGGKKGAVAGIIIGGTGAVAASKGEEVELPEGTVLTVRLERALTVPRR
jgi:hypothetical protein